MKKILLVDVDSKQPNIALMRISTYYKKMTVGYEVDLIRLGLNGYPSKHKKSKVREIDGSQYSKVYVSNIFSVNQNKFKVINNDNVFIGGVGSINPLAKLPPEMEFLDYDYSIYPDNDTAYGFITRGCHRKCYFCSVPKTEGNIQEYQNIEEITKYGFKYTSFMDNNILGYEKHLDVLDYLVKHNIKCRFSQGLDIRLVTTDNLKLLSKLKYTGEYTFAFDNVKYKKFLTDKIELVKEFIPADWKLKFYLFQDDTMSLEDLLIRIKWCQEYKVLPYIMRHESVYFSDKHFIYTDLSTWVNFPALIKKVKFFPFLIRRHIENRKNKLSLDEILANRLYTSEDIEVLTKYLG